MSNTKTDVTDSLPHGWRVVRLGDVVEVIGGSTPSRVVSEFWNGDIPWVVPTEVTNLKGRFLVSTTDTITSDGMRSAGIKMIPVNSVLLTSRATIGAVAINKIPVSTNQGFQSLVPHHDVDTLWLYYLAGSMKRQLDRLAVGSTFREVHRSTMRKVQILLPPIGQQRKIAEVLDSIDDAIERTEGVIGATEQVRDALLYELLSCGMPGWHSEWRDVPGVGTLPASWDVVRLGDVADITKGTSITKSQTILGDIPVIGGGFVPSYYHNQANRTGETVTVSASGAHAGFVSYHNSPIFASDCSTIKPKNDHISTKFLFRLLKSKQAYIYDRQSGTGQPHIYPKDLQGIRVPLPSSQEQHAIARLLNSVDDSLDGLLSERDSMQVLKRSVADGLLTGRVSVPVRD